MLFRTCLLTALCMAACGYGGPGVVDQDQVTFVIQNRLDQPRYIRWNAPSYDPVKCETSGAAGWTSCHFFQTKCAEPCLDEYQGEKCCSYCDPGISMSRILAPGESVGLAWNGKLYTYDDNHCSDCTCYREQTAPRADYRAVLCVHDDYQCGNAPCPAATEDGLLYDTIPSGTQTCHTTPFTVVYQWDTLEIPIEPPRP
jgi:hypothetical protein